ncbi:MAG: TIM44-like domain-containing protein [Fretibacterium sp.]|nr:TIM44-like domain-containing protein [Fretibacterium sp.]
MRKKFFGILTAVLLLSFCLCLVPNGTWADFGGFSGNSDYGGGGGHSGGGGGGWSGGGSGGGWSGGGSSRRSYSGGGDLFAAAALGLSLSSDFEDGMIAIIVIIVVGIIILSQRRKKQEASHQGPAFNEALPANRSLMPISGYLTLDPQFDEAKLRAHLANLYVRMQDAWHDKDISSLRPYMTDAFYNQMDLQLDGLRKARRTDCTENIAVLDTNILGYWQSGGMDYLAVRLKARIVSYILDDRTGSVVSGDRNREKFMEYEWELVRKTGVQTQEGGEIRTVNCPHCGAPLTLNASAQCTYCGSVVSAMNEDWAVSGMKGISQRTV